MNHKGTVLLETEHLLLRPFTIEDAPAVFSNWASDDEVTKYLTWRSHQNVEASQDYMRYCLNAYQDPSTYQWGIELKSTGELVGNISVVHLDESIGEAELGWVVGRAWWGQGIMPEAAAAVIRFLFEAVGANRVCAKHDPVNAKSGRVMQKVGMTFEGTLRRAARNNQGIVDTAVYSILRDEYQMN